MKILKFELTDVLRFPETDQGGGGGGGGVDETHVDDTHATDDVYEDHHHEDETHVDDTDDTKEDTPETKTPASIDPNVVSELTKAIQAGFQGQQTTQQPQQQAQHKWTPEEIEKTFRPVKVTQDLMRSLGFEDATEDQMRGFQQFAQAVVTNATHTSNYLIQQEIARMRQQLEPIQQQVQQEAQRRAYDEFFAENKDLVNHKKIVTAVANTIQPNDLQGNPKTLDQIKKEVADTTRQVLKESGIKISSPQRNTATRSAVPTMTTVGGTGRSSTSQGGSSKDNNPDADIYS